MPAKPNQILEGGEQMRLYVSLHFTTSESPKSGSDSFFFSPFLFWNKCGVVEDVVLCFEVYKITPTPAPSNFLSREVGPLFLLTFYLRLIG